MTTQQQEAIDKVARMIDGARSILFQTQPADGPAIGAWKELRALLFAASNQANKIVILIADLAIYEAALEELTPGTMAHFSLAKRVYRLATFLKDPRPWRECRSPLGVRYAY